MNINWISAEPPRAEAPSFYTRRVVPQLRRTMAVTEWTAVRDGWRVGMEQSGEPPRYAPTLPWMELNGASISVFVVQRGRGVEHRRLSTAARAHPGIVVLVDPTVADLTDLAARANAPHRAVGGFPAMAIVIDDPLFADTARSVTMSPIALLPRIGDGSPGAAIERYAAALAALAEYHASVRPHAMMPQLLARTAAALASIGLFDVPLGRVTAEVAFLAAGRRRGV